jgi:hypothetical protein
MYKWVMVVYTISKFEENLIEKKKTSFPCRYGVHVKDLCASIISYCLFFFPILNTLNFYICAYIHIR